MNYAANAVAIRERKSKWREANRESLRAADRAKYWANPEVRRQKNARYRRENKAYWVQHRAQNREAYRDVQRRRRAAIANTKVSTFAVSDLQARIDYYGNKCWICRGPYEHLDHVKPLSKGGPHMLSNLRPSCAPCNHSKGNKWPFTIKENV